MPVRPGRGGDEQFRRRHLIKLADDPVGRGACQTDGRHQCGQSNDYSQNRQEHPDRPGEHAREGFVEQVPWFHSAAGDVLLPPGLRGDLWLLA